MAGREGGREGPAGFAIDRAVRDRPDLSSNFPSRLPAFLFSRDSVPACQREKEPMVRPMSPSQIFITSPMAVPSVLICALNA